ncbi:uncharacterized protein BJ171DRAFT_600506 [Polychytrium aggregatum]|uniref:uncharacterized protein n=1 Tax=Polychytrium aggregatum TaxID=110093 RepID=UPI0022FDEE6A|nr:uncharacterized protein BJ171DRAFT_600506 [Polychytrium aggregatum]KAI9203069.1 hypothetical protein BJ171DRAFT_600506 [Polychytrium aggregatum]
MVLMGISVLIHIYNVWYFTKCFCRPGATTGFNVVMLLFVFLMTPAVIITMMVTSPLIMDTLNGTPSLATIQKYTISSKVTNVAVGFYGVTSIYTSIRIVKPLQTLIDLADGWIVVAYALDLLCFGVYLAFTLVDSLRQWKRIAQCGFLFIIYMSWLSSTSFLMWHLDKWQVALSCSFQQRGSFYSSRASSTLVLSRSIRYAYLGLICICILGIICLGLSAFLLNPYPNLSIIFVAAGGPFVASFVTVSLIMTYEIIPQRVVHIPSSDGDPLSSPYAPNQFDLILDSSEDLHPFDGLNGAVWTPGSSPGLAAPGACGSSLLDIRPS